MYNLKNKIISEVLASSAVGTFVGQVNGKKLTVECMKRVRRLLFLLSLPHTYEDKDDNVWEIFESSPSQLQLPTQIETALSNVTDRDTLVQMITLYSSPSNVGSSTLLLPGIRDLCLIANTLFGVPPATPLLEKESITELTLRYQAIAPQDATTPFGPLGSEWVLRSAEWYVEFHVCNRINTLK